MSKPMECGGSTPLWKGQPRLAKRAIEPRLACQSGTEVPHSILPDKAAEAALEKAVSSHRTPKGGAEAPHSKWHHAPLHQLLHRGIYMLTAATYQKAHFFRSPERLHLVHDRLHDCADEFGWTLQAWAVLSNHYHFVALSPDDPSNLKRFINKLHMTTAKEVNLADATPGRKVWFQYWESRITYERSYLARLRYVNENPIRHGVAPSALTYRWCSAARFAAEAEPSFVRTVSAMPIDDLNVEDDF